LLIAIALVHNFLIKMLKKILCCSLVAIAIWVFPLNPTLADSSDSLNTEAIFTANCAGCHPQGGNIIRRGKTLKAKALKRNHLDSIESIISLVTEGKGNMPAYKERLTTEEISAVSEYVMQKAATNWR
jgi:cytochrome c6